MMTRTQAKIIQRTAVNTIRFLVKQQGLKMQDLEAAMGVQPGYISRRANDPNLSIPLVAVICAADYLGVTMNDLVNPDYVRELEIDEIRHEMDRKETELIELDRRRRELGDNTGRIHLWT